METSRTNAQKKRRIQLVVQDRMNSACPMNFFRTTDTTDTTDTTIWKPGLIVKTVRRSSNKVISFFCKLSANQGVRI